jgi:16S rRNA (adenine1518-N6/adenine1519-N6)-dimethyltransferase
VGRARRPATRASAEPPPPRPRKRLGQHFLSDPRILGRIADALAPAAGDTVVEVGPGRGALTDILVRRAARVVAIELDRELAARLRERYADDPRLTVVEADVLRVSLAEAAGTPDWLLVGNVPYYITTPILFHALEPPRPTRAVFLVQREVAERVTAAPGSKVYGALTVNVRALARPELLFRVAPGAFSPAPSVESAVLRLTPVDVPVLMPHEEDGFREFVQGAFSLRRKQMRRVVRTLAALDESTAGELLAAHDIAAAARPETLSMEQFVTVYRALHGGGSAAPPGTARRPAG